MRRGIAVRRGSNPVGWVHGGAGATGRTTGESACPSQHCTDHPRGVPSGGGRDGPWADSGAWGGAVRSRFPPTRLGVVGAAAGRPRGGAFDRCVGRLGSCAPPPLTARPLGGLSGSALWARACGCGGPALFLWGLLAAGRVHGVLMLGGGLGGGGACAGSSGCAAGAGPVGRGVALPLSVPLPSLGRQQSGRHWRCAVHGGRGPPYHSGSCSPGFSGYDLCGVPVRRRGPACSSRPPCELAAGAGGRVTLRLPSRAGGAHPPCLGGWGPGPRGWRAGGGAGGGGCRAAASLLSFRAAACGTPFWLSPCRRRAPFRRARAVGAEVPPRGGGG